MNAKVRLTFIPVFLTLLSIAFGVALAFRIRTYRAMAANAPAAATQSTADGAPSSVGAPPRGGGGGMGGRADTPEGGRPHTAEESVRMVSREQRYRELLAMGNTPEAAAVKTAAETQLVKPAVAAVPKPQSALSRILQPIVNAVTGGPKPAMQSTPSPQRPDEGRKQPADEKDPNSDTQPPQLVSIEFQPPQIHDGEETTLIITATDDLSGVRGISGTLTSPTGKALQGFAQQRDGQTDRYVSRVTIPKDAEEGTWKISFLNLSDNATNMTTLSYVQGTIPPTAVLKVVSSRSDSAPPTLRSASVARRAMRSGETDALYVEADDDKSGVRLVSAVFVSPSKQARLGFGCKKGDGQTWECSINVPDCLDCGDWQLEQIQMQDNANNYTTIRQDNPIVAAVRLNITGNACDNNPPVVQQVMLDKSVLVIGQGDPVVMVRVAVSDDSCGIGGLSGQVVGPGTNAGTFFAFAPEGETGMWVGTIRLSTQSPRGIWRIQSLTVNDKGQNLRIYYASDPVLARAQFVLK